MGFGKAEGPVRTKGSQEKVSCRLLEGEWGSVGRGGGGGEVKHNSNACLVSFSPVNLFLFLFLFIFVLFWVFCLLFLCVLTIWFTSRSVILPSAIHGCL